MEFLDFLSPPVDIGTLSIILLVAMVFLLGIGMPLGFASAALAVMVLYLRFGDSLFKKFGTGQLNILANRMYGLTNDYVLISVPLFIFMACLLERSGIAKDMYSSLNVWMSRMRGGIAIVTAIMAIIMAAMSGIIGGEVVLLGLIALPQMLRLGYNQNLAIGTICASGSLGTMIPPSIVLIIYGLVTDNSIKALFTASFLPGFMLASFFIIYILIRTRLDPSQAPLPDPEPGEPTPTEKRLLFLGFLSVTALIVTVVLIARAVFIQYNLVDIEGRETEIPALSSPGALYTLIAIAGAAIAYLLFVLGPSRSKTAWDMGKGLVAPILVVGTVLGSIYGGITGITEAAGMGVVAVLIITILRGEISILAMGRGMAKTFATPLALASLAFVLGIGFYAGYLTDPLIIALTVALVLIGVAIAADAEGFTILRESLMRTIKSTGTILWVTFGATALAGAYTIAGGPTYVAGLIVGAELPTMGVILVMMLIFLILGALMDWVGIVLLVMPVFLPIVNSLPPAEIGFVGTIDSKWIPIWFGVVFCMNMQVSFLSPPFGPAAFYLKSVAPPHISLVDIFRGFLPFICIQLVALTILLIWPQITTVFLGG